MDKNINNKIITRKTQKRLVKDVKDMITNPFTSHGIYYIHDEVNILKGYALIIGPEETTLCLSDGIFSSDSAEPLGVSYGECISYSGGIAGDINGDSTVNVQDVILTVNLILSNEYNENPSIFKKTFHPKEN